MIPSWIRSSSDRPCPWYFFAIETTRRRFEFTIRSFAALSPRSMRLASVTSSSAVSSLYRPASLRKSCSASVVALTRSPFTYVTAGAFSRQQSSVISRPRSSICWESAAGVARDPGSGRLERLVERPEVLVVDPELLGDPLELGHADAPFVFAVRD